MEKERRNTAGYLLAEDIGMSSVPGNIRVVLTVDEPDCCELEEEDSIRLCCLSVPGGHSGPDWHQVIQKDRCLRQHLMKETVELLCQRMMKHKGESSALRVEDVGSFKPLIRYRMQNFHDWEGDDLESNFKIEFEEEIDQLLEQVNEFLDEETDSEDKLNVKERCVSFCMSGVTYVECEDQLEKCASEETCPQTPLRNEQEKELQTNVESFALKVLSKFPLGLSLDGLIGHLKTLLPVTQAAEEEPLKAILCTSRFFQVLSNDKYSVVLPSTNLRTMNDIERSLYTLMQIVVKICNASIPVTELPYRMETILGIPFDPSEWGITHPEDFYQHLMDKWGLNELVIVKSKSDGGTMEASSHCIQWICSSVNENDWSHLDDQNIWRTQPLRRLSDGPVPEDFVSLDHSVVSIADIIKPERIYLVRPDFMVSPIEVYVSMFENAELRDIFVDEMTKFYNRWKNHLRSRAWPQIIQEGSLVAVKFDNQWHRGLVVRISRSVSRLRLTINLFDIGECIEKVSCRNVYPVHKDFANEPQQTFKCRLPLEELDKYFHISAGNKWFTKSALEDFYDILQDKVIAIIPHRRILQENCWEVSVLLTEDSSVGKNVIVGDLLTMFIAQQCGDDDDEDKRSKKSSACVNGVSECSASQQSPGSDVSGRHDEHKPANLPSRGHSACRGRGWGWYPRGRIWGRQ